MKNATTFEQAWSWKVQQGYKYGEDALGQVRFGWEMAQDAHAMDVAASDEVDPAYWRGHDDAVAGVANRWREALEDPVPKPGVMNEPLESLYRRTGALRARAAVEVIVERGRVWIKRGVQSFMLAYDSDIEEERQWYAAQLRKALGIDEVPA